MLALVFRLGNCDYQKLCDFREAEPKRYQELLGEMAKIAGTRLLPLPTPRNDVLFRHCDSRFIVKKQSQCQKFNLTEYS